MEINRLTITTESRILGDEYVRFGGEYIETCFHKGKKGALCLAIGTGKTLIMCIAAHEMKRLNLAYKPMIIGLKANVAEIAATYQAAYPNARILYASEKDFSTANRVRFFNNIKNNDYDCVIMSHDQFVNLNTLIIMALGLVAFVFDSIAGVMFAKLLNLFCKNKVNPMVGAAGISAFPMSARVIQKMGQEADCTNHLLMHAVGANVAGQIASVLAGGMILNLVPQLMG